MNELWKRWRVAIGMVVAASAAVLVLVIFVGPAPSVTSDPNAKASAAASTPGATTAAPVVAQAPLAAATTAAKATTTSVWPDPPAKLPGEKATWDESYGDPFESDAGRPSDVRELVRVGAFRLGVTNDSKVKDHGAVVAVLKELGTEIDTLDRGRTDSFEKRVVEYQSVYDRYRPKLAPHMEGSFALKGNGWTDTERLEHPRADAGAPHAP
ncbi:MAG: hypothetical protein HYV09_37320 [Deltaproteobacteria bacterium]|nr:hypothetical protein [Deltaproteobacteria bacterium]